VIAKNIVICSDGTSNEFGENNTNVVKLHTVLERGEAQATFYDPGVGTWASARTSRTPTASS
jgi:uncharacterized protein (DUF2235 family)